MCAIVVGCGSSEEFTINGKIKGIGNQSLQLVYYADGAVKTKNATTNNGAFSFTGSSAQPVIADIYAGGDGLIGRVIIKNGENVECEFDKNNLYKLSMSGTTANEEWAKFLSQNSEIFASGNAFKINQLIETYIGDHKDNIVSTALLVTEYRAAGNEHRADSLLSSINADARPQSIVESYSAMLLRVNSTTTKDNLRSISLYTTEDTTFIYNPTRSTMSLLCFTTDRSDSIATTLGTLSEAYDNRRLAIVDISLLKDTTEWKHSIKNDSAAWTQAWLPGAVMARQIERLGVPRTPYFIVVDSTAAQVYRGTSLSTAAGIIKSHFK